MPDKEHQTAASDTSRSLYGLLAEFETPDQVLDAAGQVRDAGYREWDVHSPFPIHGMDGAMGVRRTLLPRFVFVGGLAGAATALALQGFTNTLDYPFIVSGKPFFSLPASIPVTFELTVLFSAIAAVIGMFILNRLPEWYHPLFANERFRRATDDRFFIVIEARDPLFDPIQTREFLRSAGAAAVEPLEA